MPGAIAEFRRDESEAWTADRPGSVVTALGAMRLNMDAPVRPYAYEILSARPGLWHHGVVLALPAETCTMARRRVITELGEDHEAIRPQDRESILFDLGLDSPYCDFYIRAWAPEHVRRLRQASGTSLLEACCELYDDIVRMSPHRVFVSRLGRIEIYQPIGKPGSLTPHGPHTHLLPKLFRPGRSQFSTTALPGGYAPCMTLYPPNAVFDREGLPKRFDAAEHHAFQSLLTSYGEAQAVEVKQAVWRTVRAGAPPHALDNLSDRRSRIAARVALRQIFQMDGSSPLLSEWRSTLERGVHKNVLGHCEKQCDEAIPGIPGFATAPRASR